jgi:hypothetical protein
MRGTWDGPLDGNLGNLRRTGDSLGNLLLIYWASGGSWREEAAHCADVWDRGYYAPPVS